jgi:hypothetical protein
MEGSPLGWKPTTSHAACRIPEGQSAVTLGQEPMAAHGMVSYGLEAQPVQHPPPTGCGQRTPTVGVSVERGGGSLVCDAAYRHELDDSQHGNEGNEQW